MQTTAWPFARIRWRIFSFLFGFGFIAYVAIQLLLGRPREVHLLMYVASAAFAAYFLLT